jgi:hypothetical protein
VAEGLTMQYDNLLCTMLFYTVLMLTHSFFMEMSFPS